MLTTYSFRYSSEYNFLSLRRQGGTDPLTKNPADPLNGQNVIDSNSAQFKLLKTFLIRYIQKSDLRENLCGSGDYDCCDFATGSWYVVNYPVTVHGYAPNTSLFSESGSVDAPRRFSSCSSC